LKVSTTSSQHILWYEEKFKMRYFVLENVFFLTNENVKSFL